MARRPPPHTALCSLDRSKLSSRAQEQLKRIRAFLVVVNRPPQQTLALLAGYTPELHLEGACRASLVSGERPFGEWREWRALRPPRDPDLPDLVNELERFAEKWQSRAMAAAAAIVDDDERAELEDALQCDRGWPSRTWRAKARVQFIEHLAKVPLESHQRAWETLVEQGIEGELRLFRERLSTVQNFIRNAELDAQELSDIHEAREEGVGGVEEWLRARRQQFVEHMPEETLTLLALGEPVPPPIPDVPIHLLAEFRFAGSA